MMPVVAADVSTVSVVSTLVLMPHVRPAPAHRASAPHAAIPNGSSWRGGAARRCDAWQSGAAHHARGGATTTNNVS
eukprot:3139713-Pleurochrysis_carterae.AAC.2